jgi:hypothetical protein
MKVLYILKNELTKTAKTIYESHKKSHEVLVVKLEDKSANELLDLIETHDKLIMW